ncbi:MAG TPA: TM2 domain-containing protein [Roseomonas sp.]|jgi:TM2 domain-containing membrane protein YozV
MSSSVPPIPGPGQPQAGAAPTNDALMMMRYDANKKSAVVAYLLWFFVGWFGAHRFYLGRTGSAVAMLIITLASFALTVMIIGVFGFGVIGIWLLVDAFLIPGMIAAENNKLIASLRTT